MAFLQNILDSILPFNQEMFEVSQLNHSHCEGGAGPDKKLIMMSLIYSLDAQLVYETGFNAGQMAAFICLALEKTGGKYIGFEIQENIKPVVKYLQDKFPGIPEVCWGDSAITVPERLRLTNEKPDIFFVDGNHTKEGLQTDLRNAISCVRKGGIIMIDDVDTLRPYINEILPDNEFIWFQGSQYNGPGCGIYQVK